MMSYLLSTIVIGMAVLLSFPVGKWMYRVMCPASLGDKTKMLNTFLGEEALKAQDWKQYFLSMLCFNAVIFVITWGVLAICGNMSVDLLFHTVTSFVTNTNMQHYPAGAVNPTGAVFGLMWLQFLSAATGIAVFVQVCRLVCGQGDQGNFYLDTARATLGILLPLAFISAILLVLCGVPMQMTSPKEVEMLEGGKQWITLGPVAAFTAIKQLGTNGGGYFGQNSAHPFENVNFYSNIIECVLLILIPMACIWLFGHITQRRRDARLIFIVLLAFLIVKTTLAVSWESKPAAAVKELPVAQSVNLEGKELRFGVTAAPVWSALTTCSSNGSVNSMHSSLNPLTSLVPLAGMWFNVTFGGVGSGFLGLFAYIIVAVFISGLMVGRTPEYLGHKVETPEMKYAILMLLLHPLCILVATSLFCLIPGWGRDTVLNAGFHGFTEILYEMTSASANNGSEFEGLNNNTVPWNMVTGIIMLVGRYLPIFFSLAIAGSLYAKKIVPDSTGTLRTDTVLFGVVLSGVVIFVGALLFMPVAVLGPLSEFLTTLGR